ncbi:polymer-forming cytoskeletal protein [Hydrogenophaga sp. IBVHS2]|uniref:bactofilin family protein n=1 Tax=Hydrogenophaga sp. IBVHS2 TaxID=1985170 RepID=UPI000A2E68DE|nr:polymer-forming cytoskeletal protein [Hydrogenophaga sp. IBVHS2]OSZ63815.1 cell shape determination protein CcmA [Hydrogenophaga sp. IBVHS2]
MFGKKNPPPIKSLIANGTRIEGDITFSEGLRVDGTVVGHIKAAEGKVSILVVSEVAEVTGRIEADHVIINGRVKGPVVAHGLLELQPKACIEGDVAYKALEMHQGATISGQLKPLSGENREKPTLLLAANGQ